MKKIKNKDGKKKKAKTKAKAEPISTLVINLYGGPGSGKSTLMAGLFAYLKNRNVNCEMAPEYAKEKVWEGSYRILENQIYVFAKQHHRINRLLGSVSVVITDSPLLLSLYYGGNKSRYFNELVHDEYLKLKNMDVFVRRCKPYNPKGRRQTKKQAVEIDTCLRRILRDNALSYVEVFGEEDSIAKLGEIVLHRLKNKPIRES